ncbi:MAG: BatD family protein [Oleispira sp.]
MVKTYLTQLFSVLTLALLLLTNSAAAGTLTASVDRKQITENDSFRLFLRYDEQVGFGQPDLTVLKKDFRVINQQRANQFRSMNGKTVSFTEWTLMLSPLRSGTLIIPAVEFDGQRSQAIEVSVNELSQSVKNQIAKEFFFDIEVDSKSTYVQAQVIYTEKLYYSVNHEDPTLSEFKVTNAHVMPLGEVRQYNTNINGQRMGVYERRFAIFAEESGEMVIPGQKFSANIVNAYNRWSRGRPVSVVAEPIRIAVKSTPSSYPQASWLPSPQITISDRWSKPYSEWQVGEPITRSITINARGLSGSQLPKIALPLVEGLKYYPDQSEHNDKTDSQGIEGVLEQSLAIVPTQSGRVTIPEMRIPWWNVESNRLEYAILPAQTVTVSAPETALKIDSSQQNKANTDAANNAAAIRANDSGYWIAATLFLLITNLISAFLLWSRSNKPLETETQSAEPSNKERLKQLKKACQQNDPALMRQTLKNWSQQEFEISSLDQLAQQFNSVALTNSLNELDSILYQNSENSAFNGQILWNNLSQAIKKNQSNLTTDQPELSPLYQ